jgi:hypothetical protein
MVVPPFLEMLPERRFAAVDQWNVRFGKVAVARLL